MTKEMRKLLQAFQCDFNRTLEETFAKMLAENEAARLFFINENQAFTDGQNIVVDPAYNEAFTDLLALQNTEKVLQLDNKISSDPWYALRMITRGQTIHECLHILYTTFPVRCAKDPIAKTAAERSVLGLIDNIIEDCYIEAVGCSLYDNLELHLQFLRIVGLFCAMKSEGTVSRALGQVSDPSPAENLRNYLNYMATFLLYPMLKLEAPDKEIVQYVKKTKQLFLDGSVCGDPEQRYTYSQRIFSIIKPLIPPSEEEVGCDELKQLLYGAKTHETENGSLVQFRSEGRKVKVTRRLFTDLEGNLIKAGARQDQVDAIVDAYENEKTTATQLGGARTVVVNMTGSQFDCHRMHKKIEIVEKHPKPNTHLKKAYQNIVNKYRVSINSYNSRFSHLLNARVDVHEEKKLFGTGISSRRLSDVKKRYWYHTEEGTGVPDLAILLLIDGSGSMSGDRRENSMISSVILHEVLKNQGITHAIAEHRAVYEEPKIQCNILVDFHGKPDEKFNILALDADDGTREGLALYWAERYIGTQAREENKLILVISDGGPYHYDGEATYGPPVSVKDAANAAKKIVKRGTNIIAIALEDEAGGCYDALCEIYSDVIKCKDLKRLTGQLLEVISRQLRA